VAALKAKARRQLGTVGGGNHYVDVFADETETLWVGVHFGSRGLGHTVATGFTALGQGRRWGERAAEREVLLPLGTALGDDYWRSWSSPAATPTPGASGWRARWSP
jgi:tRNA-splicing ligase RtcB